jgi:hypothetical protein
MTQGGAAAPVGLARVHQLLLSMLAGMAAAKKDLHIRRHESRRSCDPMNIAGDAECAALQPELTGRAPLLLPMLLGLAAQRLPWRRALVQR